MWQIQGAFPETFSATKFDVSSTVPSPFLKDVTDVNFSTFSMTRKIIKTIPSKPHKQARINCLHGCISLTSACGSRVAKLIGRLAMFVVMFLVILL